MVTVDGAGVRALAYPALVGSPRVGDRVLLNVSALDAGLGTGGYAFVVAIPDRLPADPDEDSPGHMVKSRYTPLQAMVASADEQGSPHHELLRDADSLDGMPVVVADLHSALPAILAGLYSANKKVHFEGTGGGFAPTVAYVMTDGGALPAWFSRTIAGLREAGWLAAAVTTGQSFGGDLEAVTLHSGLLAARHVAGADVAIVAQGPGNLGTGTRWGFSGVAAGEAVNAAATLGGRPVASLRLSFADPRSRHQGVSHHSLTAYGRVALARADVVLPALPAPQVEAIAAQAASLADRHHLVTVDLAGLDEALRSCPVPLSTMGRSLDEDLEYFLAAAAAGRHALSLLLRAISPQKGDGADGELPLLQLGHSGGARTQTWMRQPRCCSNVAAASMHDGGVGKRGRRGQEDRPANATMKNPAMRDQVPRIAGLSKSRLGLVAAASGSPQGRPGRAVPARRRSHPRAAFP
jgi:hypothetical protein